MQIRDALSRAGDEVELFGWVYRIRSGKEKVFLVLRDATGILQCVIGSEQAGFKDAAGLSIESSVRVNGRLRVDERAPGKVELRVSGLEIIHKAERFPITKNQSAEFLLDVRHLWLRSRKLTNVMRIKAELLKLTREWFEKNGFTEVTPPILTGSNCEGGADAFPLKYFGKKAFLSQSAQLYLEALIFSLERVYSLTPSFRAEKSRTRRHLTEYMHLEAEAANCDIECNLKIQEELIAHVVNGIAVNCETELLELGRNPNKIRVKLPLQRLSYESALELLEKKGHPVEWGSDIGSRDEEIIMEEFDQPIFVTRYPRGAKAFYMKCVDGKHAECADMLAPEGYGEIIGGSEREDSITKLLERMKEEKLNEKDYEWYLDLRRYGSVPHSGFGLGIERVVRWLCKLDHIRDTTPFPRLPNRVTP